MRLFSFRNQQNERSVGVLCAKDSQQFVDLCATDSSIPNHLLSLIESDATFIKAKQALTNPNAVIRDLANIQFDTLIDRPGKIVCMGLNYADHAKEGGNARPEYPSFFMRGPSSLAAHNAPLIRPSVSDKIGRAHV